eukprot:9671789-Lingulodinium_polyedra.AAC.1
MKYGALVELDDSCDDREWLSTEPTASDFRGLWLHSLLLWSSTESVKTADFVQNILNMPTWVPRTTAIVP